MRSIKKHIALIKYHDAGELQANRMLNFASHQENEMYVTRYILKSNYIVRRLKSSCGGTRLGTLSFVLMIVKELRYLLLDKGVYTRHYSDGALCKPRGIWWLGRNRFIRIVASAASLDWGGGSGKGGASSDLRGALCGQALQESVIGAAPYPIWPLTELTTLKRNKNEKSKAKSQQKHGRQTQWRRTKPHSGRRTTHHHVHGMLKWYRLSNLCHVRLLGSSIWLPCWYVPLFTNSIILY